jgi:hypothetical protein
MLQPSSNGVRKNLYRLIQAMDLRRTVRFYAAGIGAVARLPESSLCIWAIRLRTRARPLGFGVPGMVMNNK